MEDKRTKKLRLRFITLCANEDFFHAVKKGMKDAADFLNADTEFVGTDDIDIPLQVSLCEKAISDSVDGIALNLPDKTAFNDVVQKAKNAGIPVIAFNMDASDGKAGNLSKVCQDTRSAGRTLGQLALPTLKMNGKVLMTVHSEGISGLEERLKGIQEIISAKNIRWEVLNTGNEPQLASGRITEALNADPDISAILCSGQTDTEGAGISLEKNFPDRELYIGGFDVSPGILRFIQKGIIAVTIDQQPYLQGFFPVVQLVLNIRYGITPSNIDAGANVIDKDNVGDVLSLSIEGYR